MELRVRVDTESWKICESFPPICASPCMDEGEHTWFSSKVIVGTLMLESGKLIVGNVIAPMPELPAKGVEAPRIFSACSLKPLPTLLKSGRFMK